MGPLRLLFSRARTASHARQAGRSHLKAAKSGDREQYLALAASYLNLATGYFGNTVSESSESRAARVVELFSRLRETLGYAERLSDFEFMLARALIENVPEQCSITSTDPLVTKLRLLDPEIRFAFIAYECEKWPLRWVALALRVRGNALHRMLSEARCELCGVGWESLAKEEQSCLEAISVSMDLCPNVRANRQLSQRIKAFPRVATIRAQWLELRPELVEVRHRYLTEPAERDLLLKQIFASMTAAPVQRPPLVDRMVNTVRFSRHARIQVS